MGFELEKGIALNEYTTIPYLSGEALSGYSYAAKIYNPTALAGSGSWEPKRNIYSIDTKQ